MATEIVLAQEADVNSASDRYSGSLPEYYNQLEQFIPAKSRKWIQDRRNNAHLALPYYKKPYDLVVVNVPSSYEQGAVPTKEEPPIGALRCVASANSMDLTAGLLDAHALNMSLKQIEEQLEQLMPRIVGINPTSVNVPEAKALAELLDRRQIDYVVGGIHATMDPARARADFENAFAIIKGDGEIALPTVVRHAIDGTPVSSGTFLRDQDLALSFGLPYAPKLDIGLMPIIRQEDYVQYPLVLQTIEQHGNKIDVVEASTYMTRGCPFECGFCSSPVMVGRGMKGVRPYDHPGMDKVVDEVERLMDIGADAIHFLDDMVMVQPKDVAEFHDIAKERGLLGKFLWRGMTRAPVVARNSFTPEILDKLAASGCWRMTLGVESGNDDMLSAIKKQITTEDVRGAVRKLVSAGIGVKAFFIMGFPGETYEQMLDTYNFVMELKSMGLGSISIFQFKPYPGTMLWDKIAKENPDAFTHLDYIGGDARSEVGGKRGVQGVYLPDDLVIADRVPSGIVRELVQKTLADFFN